MKENITFPQLVELVAKKANTTNRMSELFLQELFAVAAQSLANGETVKIKGLGTFKTATVENETQVLFTPDKTLADAVNAPFAQFSPVELCDEVTTEMLNEIDASMEKQDESENPDVGTRPVSFEVEETTSPENEPQDVETKPVSPEKEEASSPENEPQDVVTKPESSENEPQDVGTKPVSLEPAQEEKSGSSRKWLLAAAAAIALIAVWYFFTHRSKGLSDKAIESTQVAVNDSSATQKDTTPPIVTDTIGHGNVLFTMSKKHYGDQAFWVYIARENQAQYPDYRKIKSGAVLVIPPAEKYGINSDSKESLRIAGAEAMKLYKEVRAADTTQVESDTKTETQKAISNKTSWKSKKKHSSWKSKKTKSHGTRYRSRRR
ncbi:MAG: HU family DNA-binding protein [Muribaculaceae bacterium]|nr:HU family DNA-binding protein [Muribaculaceae bacterium]